jgi:hypothetical protein
MPLNRLIRNHITLGLQGAGDAGSGINWVSQGNNQSIAVFLGKYLLEATNGTGRAASNGGDVF